MNQVYNDIVFSFQELLLSQFNRAVLSMELKCECFCRIKKHGLARFSLQYFYCPLSLACSEIVRDSE